MHGPERYAPGKFGPENLGRENFGRENLGRENFLKKRLEQLKKIWYSIGHGALAQLGARLNGIQKVVGSNPICSIFYADMVHR